MATEPIHTAGVRHEIRDANIPALTAFGAGIVLTVAVTMIFCWWLFRIYAYELPMGPPLTPYASSRQLPPEPRLPPLPQLDLYDYLTAQRKELDSYSWVDKQKGVVRIPIARAMQLLLKQGLPARSGPSAGTITTADGYSLGMVSPQATPSRRTPEVAHRSVAERRKR